MYALLLLLVIAAYSTPWARIGADVYVGWNFTVPYSFTYVIGIVIGLVVLATRAFPVALTVVAGLLMLLGVFGAVYGISEVKATFTIIGAFGKLQGVETPEVETEWGLGFAFVIAIVYTVAGAYVGKKMSKH